MSKSANLAFHLIAVQKHVLPKARLDLALKQADAQGVSIEGYLLDTGNLDLPGIERIVSVRERHGRACQACGQKTYLLPGETLKKGCEHCGGALLAPPKPPAPVAAPAPDAPAPEPSPESPPAPSLPPVAPAPAPVTPPKVGAGRPPTRPSGSGPARPRPSAPAPAAATEALTVAMPTPSASDYGVDEPPPPPKPVIAHADESEEEKKARLRRLRQIGGGLGSEPVAPLVAEATPEPAPPPAPSRRFAPPPVAPADDPVVLDDALFAPPRPAADDDARFAPPAAHRTAAPAGLQGIVDRPTRPLTEELGTLLGFPGSPFGLFMVSAGAALLFLISAVILNPIGIRPLPALLALVPLLLYVYSYLVVVTESASQGREELPDWPDIGAAVGLGWRMFLAYVASFAPALVVFCIALKASGGLAGVDPKVHPTVGPDAVKLAGSKAIVAPGTSARDAKFLTLDGNPIALGGKWTIVGLIGKDTVDDTGMDETFSSMPSAGMGVVIDHAAQIHDLDRVGRALKEKVAVYAAFADPRCKIVWGRHPYAVPDSVRQQHGYTFDHESSVGEVEDTVEPPSFDGHAGDDEELGDFDVSDETAEGLRRAQGTAGKNALAQGGPAPRAVAPANPFRTITFIRGDEFVTFPAPFHPVRRLPAVYVLDPQGVIKREYATGVDDRQLYGDLLDLMSGGDGDALRTDLPPSAYGITAKGLGAGKVVAGGLVLLLIGFGVFYLPMAILLMVSFNDGGMAFQYPAGLRAIGAATKDYLVVAGLFVGTTVVGWVVSFVATITISKLMGPILGWAVREYVNHWIWFYGALVSAYAVGRFYYRNRDTIGWFSSRR